MDGEREGHIMIYESHISSGFSGTAYSSSVSSGLFNSYNRKVISLLLKFYVSIDTTALPLQYFFFFHLTVPSIFPP